MNLSLKVHLILSIRENVDKSSFFIEKKTCLEIYFKNIAMSKKMKQFFPANHFDQPFFQKIMTPIGRFFSYSSSLDSIHKKHSFLFSMRL